MSAEIYDTYFFLYDNPGHRRLDLCSFHVQYKTPSFSKDVYEAHRGQVFASVDEAYRDWVDTGRSLGICYAEGKDTLLKIVLKVKDEPELIGKWIEHHAGIAGYHNLVIMNCGSTDPRFLEMLHQYRDRILILDYDQYYDNLSFPHMNPALFSMLARNCKYLTILDADEFLFGYEDGTLSQQHVAKILREGAEDVYAGTWITNATPPLDNPDGSIAFSSPITFSLHEGSIKDGTFAGKSVTRASRLFEAAYVGHNLHVSNVMARMREGSFGKLFVLHLANLSPRLVRLRALKHLHAKEIVPRDMPLDEVEPYLNGLTEEELSKNSAKEYVNRFLGAASIKEKPPYFAVELLCSPDAAPESHPEFSAAIEEFDFKDLLKVSLENCKIVLR